MKQTTKFKRGVLVTTAELEALDKWVERLTACEPPEVSALNALQSAADDALASGDTWGLTSLTNAIRSTVAYISLRANVESPYAS